MLKKRWAMLSVSAVVGTLVCWGASRALADEGASEAWEVRGVMSDACQCQVLCPCEFLSTPTLGHCDDAAILHIDQGHYGGTRLDGLEVAVVSQSPEGERLVDTVGHLTFARIYVPEGSDDAQTEALAEVARRVFGSFVNHAARLSENEEIRRVAMETDLAPLRHQVRIPGILELDLEAIRGADGEEPMMLENGPFEGFGFGPVIIARSTTYRYTDAGVDWDYGGRSASIRSFELSGSTALPPADEMEAEPAVEHAHP